MKALEAVSKACSQWIDCVAQACANLLDKFARPSTVRLVQTDDDHFHLRIDGAGTIPPSQRIRIKDGQLEPGLKAHLSEALSGARVEIALKPDLFIFKPIELPSRAADFLGGIVRAQIDRLTPWPAATAAFGWSHPSESGSDRMVVTIAATARAFLQPYVDTVTALGAHSVSIVTTPPEGNPSALPIRVLDQRALGTLEIATIRKALVIALTACGISTGVTLATAAVIDAHLDSREAELGQKLARIRADASTAQQSLERRKHNDPSAVMVLDALSEILPDHTYVTELRIEANKVRLIGLTRDAPSLIELIERSRRFSRASFFAPTTRSSEDGRERFHIEAIIQPAPVLRS